MLMRSLAEGVELYCGDCRDILPSITERRSIVTDPPFSIRQRFGRAVGRPGKGIRALQFEWDAKMTREEVVDALSLACGDQTTAFFSFCGLSQASLIEDAMAEQGFICKPAAWVKKHPPPAGKGNWWPSGMQLAVYGYRKGAWFGDTDAKRSNVFVADSYRHGNKEKNGHPTQTPLILMERYVGSIAAPGSLVVDPFMGSGTTGVAAIRTGRRFIGIEIEPKWFDLSCRQIEAALQFRGA